MNIPLRLVPVCTAVVAFLIGSLSITNNSSAQVTRKDINTLKATDQVIVSYLKAIDAMKKLPANDPHNWVFQANIHDTAMMLTDTTWGTCQHSTWFFLPWHRAYIWYFEKIIQKQSGDATFALPYWNWTLANSRTLPALFRDPTSQLFDLKRDLTVNAGTKTVDNAWMTTDYPADMAMTTFFTAQGMQASSTFGGVKVMGPVHFQPVGGGGLELSPHNRVHVWFGNNSDMINPQTAAQDPAFWSHHCMIDKAWEDWLAQGGGRVNPTGETGWMNQTFEFYDENKNKVTKAVKDLLDTKALGYVYNDPPKKKEKKGVSIEGKKQRTMAEKDFAKPVVLGKEPLTVVLKFSPEEKANFARLVQKDISLVTFNLGLEGVTFGDGADPKHKKRVNADSSIEVFLNAPEDAKLDTKSAYYGGGFAFFGPVHNGSPVMNLSPYMEKMRKAKGFKDVDQIKITLLRVWPSGPPAEINTPLTFKKIRFLVNE